MSINKLSHDEVMPFVKTLRVEIDKNIVKSQGLRDQLPAGQREIALVITKLQEAKMWAGKILEELGSPFPKELADKSNE